MTKAKRQCMAVKSRPYNAEVKKHWSCHVYGGINTSTAVLIVAHTHLLEPVVDIFRVTTVPLLVTGLSGNLIYSFCPAHSMP